MSEHGFGKGLLPVTSFDRKSGKVNKAATKTIRKQSKASARVAKELAGQGLQDLDRLAAPALRPEAHGVSVKLSRTRRTAIKGVFERRSQGKDESK